MKKRDWILYSIVAVIFLAYLFMLIDILIIKDYFSLFWTCYLAIPLIIIGIIKKNSSLIVSQVIILALTDLFWIFDFLSLIILGHTILGIEQVNIFPFQSWIIKLGNLQHLIVIPLSILALSILKVKRNYKTLLISLAEISLFFVITLLIVPSSMGVNCINMRCVGVPLTFLPYPLVWFLLVFSFITASYFIITSLPFIKKKSR